MHPLRRTLLALALAAGGLPALTVSGSAQTPGNGVNFIGVAPDDDYRNADAKLVALLERATGESLQSVNPVDYGAAIKHVVEHKQGDKPYLARLTPYAFVVAEIQGAQFETLATYRSKATGGITYYSYFVVNGNNPTAKLPASPGLRDLREFLVSSRRQFAFHDKFSTSSYFIPLTYFRSLGVFDVDRTQPAGAFTPIVATQTERGTGSSDLVKMVLAGKADLAAVWDGTKKKFEKPEFSALRFIRIETPLPNDLLVCSNDLPAAQKEAIKAALEKLNCTNGESDFGGDFQCWVSMKEAKDARSALAALRRAATAPPAPATIRITHGKHQAPDDAVRYAPYLLAARQAIKLAGTEFVAYDPDFHKWADVDWDLELVHDGALKLTSTVNGKFMVNGVELVKPETFEISFTNTEEDLIRRLEDVIDTRLNRIRYIWPFETKVPTVVRDVGFSLPTGAQVAVERITWRDPEKNEFARGDVFASKVTSVDSHKFQLDASQFPTQNSELELNPMSNTAYRVILVRPVEERALFHYMTLGLVLLLVAGAAAAAYDYRRLLRARSS